MNIRTTLNDNARDVIISNRLRWSQKFESFKNMQSETGDKGNNSEETMTEIWGKYHYKCCCVLTENI
jgi:hypothetical protein